MGRKIRENLDLLIQTKENLKNAINIQGGSIDTSTPFSEYADQIDDLIVGDGINWPQIGFNSEPEEITKGYDYAKYMVDHKSEFPGIGTNKLDVSNNTSLIYLPSCNALGVNKNDISVLSFYNCRNLVWINDKELHTQKVKFNSNTFRGCISLKYIPKLDISTYTYSDNQLFSNLYSLEVIDPANNTEYWYNTTSTNDFTGFSSLFNGCKSLKTLPVIDCGKIPVNNAYLHSTFAGCYSLTDVSIINTTNIKSCNSLFSYCYSLTTVPQFNTQNVTDMTGMFQSCTSLTTVPQFNTQNVTNMFQMFSKCYSLTTVPELNTQNVTSMSSMFANCTSLTTINGLDFKSISSESNSNLGNSYSIRKMYIKNIGYSNCPTYNFSSISNWGVNTTSIPDASLSIYKSLVEDTSNRAGAGSSIVNIKLHSNSLSRLDNTAKAAICAKGYTLNGTSY